MSEQTEENGHSIRDIPPGERPRERLETRGVGALSDAELMAILLRVGVAGSSAVELGRSLLQRFGGLRGLHSAHFDELCAVRGVGRAKAAQLKAAIELGYRLSQESESQRITISSAADVDQVMRHLLSGKNQEELWVLALTTRNRLIRKEQLYIGTVNHSSVRMAEIFEIALRCQATAIILVHNHPSGDPAPSEDDIRFTEELVKAGRLMDVGVLDHVIIGSSGHESIRRTGRVAFHAGQSRQWG